MIPTRLSVAFLTLAASFAGSLSAHAQIAPVSPAAPAPAEQSAPPIPVPAGVRKLENITYQPTGHKLHTLDLYLPASRPADAPPMPLIVWIHSGNWKMGDKAFCPAASWAAHGVAVASINYRLAPEFGLADMARDVRAAVRFLQTHAADHAINPNRIGLWGISAGAHLAALVATTPDIPELDTPGTTPLRVQACAVWFGPMDLTKFKNGDKLLPDLDLALSSPTGSIPAREPVARKFSPLTYVTKDDPPFVFFHGENNDQVPKEQTELMVAALKAAGVAATAYLIPNQGHGFRPKSEFDKYVDQTEKWFASVLATDAAPPSSVTPNTP